jgi:hypothetical protein
MKRRVYGVPTVTARYVEELTGQDLLPGSVSIKSDLVCRPIRHYAGTRHQVTRNGGSATFAVRHCFSGQSAGRGKFTLLSPILIHPSISSRLSTVIGVLTSTGLNLTMRYRGIPGNLFI